MAIFDLQIGSMGGMAVTMSMRLDESSGRLPHVPVLMLLDRIADVHLAKRSGADGWLVKPLDPLRLRRAVRAVLRGDTYHEGLVDGQRGVQPMTAAHAEIPDSGVAGRGRRRRPRPVPVAALPIRVSGAVRVRGCGPDPHGVLGSDPLARIGWATGRLIRRYGV